MIESTRQRIEREAITHLAKRLATQRLADVRAVVATPEGRRLMHWLVYEEGGLQTVVPPEDEGRRRLAIAICKLLDAAEPGCVEEIALEARKQRIADEASIASAIADRSDEYE